MKVYDGIAIAIAWPETLCKQAGSWYDMPLMWLGLNKNHYYKVGHAAVVLIDIQTKVCHYFDFGRYHAPFQHGRVRSCYTDHDLEMKTEAIIKNGKLLNYKDILIELYNNEACHGSGDLHASYCLINFSSAYEKATQMQSLSPIRYGPFLPNGTNCSRFVNAILLSGKPNIINRILLIAPKTLTPTPIGNVRSLKNRLSVGEINNYNASSKTTNYRTKMIKREFSKNLS